MEEPDKSAEVGTRLVGNAVKSLVPEDVFDNSPGVLKDCPNLDLKPDLLDLIVVGTAVARLDLAVIVNRAVTELIWPGLLGLVLGALDVELSRMMLSIIGRSSRNRHTTRATTMSRISLNGSA